MPRFELLYEPRIGLQEEFHEARGTPFRWCFAGTGSGKSYSAAFEVTSLMLAHPGSRWGLSEPDMPMVKRVMIPIFEELWGCENTSWEGLPFVKRWNRTDHALEFVNGSTAFMVGLKEAGKIEGPNLDGWWADEIRVVRDWDQKFKGIHRRLRGSSAAMRAAMRPQFIGTTHSPTKGQIEKAEGPEHIKGSTVFRWSTLDAIPVMGQEWVDLQVRENTGRAAEAVLEGLHAPAEGVVYDEFDARRHVKPAPPFHEFDLVTYGVDWGYRHNAAIIAIGWKGSQGHVVEEFYGTRYQREDLVEAAKAMEKRWGRGTFFCGHERPQDIDYFRTEGLDAESQQAGKVEAGTEWINAMWAGDELHIDPSCTNLRREIEEDYVMDEDKGVPDKKGSIDDAADSARYAIMGRSKVRLARSH